MNLSHPIARPHPLFQPLDERALIGEGGLDGAPLLVADKIDLVREQEWGAIRTALADQRALIERLEQRMSGRDRM